MKQPTITKALNGPFQINLAVTCEFPLHTGRCRREAWGHYTVRTSGGGKAHNVPLCLEHSRQGFLHAEMTHNLHDHYVKIDTVDSTEDDFGFSFSFWQARCTCGGYGPLRDTFGEASADGYTHVPKVEGAVNAYL